MFDRPTFCMNKLHTNLLTKKRLTHEFLRNERLGSLDETIVSLVLHHARKKSQ